MRPHRVALGLLLAVPAAALRAQSVVADPEPAVRLVTAAYLRATTAAGPDQAPLLRTTLRLADSVLAAAPTRRMAASVFLVRGFAALALSRDLRGAAAESGRCADARAARAMSTSAADAPLADTGPERVAPTPKAARLARAEEDSAERLVRRLCTAGGG
jgi:hypothetical protein